MGLIVSLNPEVIPASRNDICLYMSDISTNGKHAKSILEMINDQLETEKIYRAIIRPFSLAIIR